MNRVKVVFFIFSLFVVDMCHSWCTHLLRSRKVNTYNFAFYDKRSKLDTTHSTQVPKSKLVSSNAKVSPDIEANSEFKFDYISCFKCSSTYVVDKSQFRDGGVAVRCSVCGAIWTQIIESILTGDKRLCELQDVSAERAELARKLLQNNIRPKPNPMTACVFVRNILPTWGDFEVGEKLFYCHCISLLTTTYI